MKEGFLDVKRINKLKKANLKDSTLKFAEESGELIREVNRTLGIKRRNRMTDEEIKTNVLEEIADSIQCLFSIADFYEISLNEIEDELLVKNIVWETSKEK